MNFEYNLLQQHKLNRTNKDGKRVYINENGDEFVSVTTALNYLSKNGIARWRQNIGYERANKISSQAARAGTALHNVAEQYVLKNVNWNKLDPISIDKFLKIKPYIDNNINIIYGIELQMYSNEIKAAGTTDLICNYNNKKTILDFKTSRRIKTKDKIVGYWIQAAAYAIMAKELYNMDIEQLVILMTVNDGVGIEFIEPANKWIQIAKQYFKHYHAGKLV